MTTNRKIIIYILFALVVVLGLLMCVIPHFMSSDDEYIKKYKEALNASLELEYYHYKEKLWYEHEKEAINDSYEYYKSGPNSLDIETRYDGTEILKAYGLSFDGKTYTLIEQTNGIDVRVEDFVYPGLKTPNGIDSTYYSINDRNVTYEENDTQIIVTYNNRFMVGKSVVRTSLLEEEPDGYKSATSIAFFDKNWKLEKIQFIEKWDCITDAGEKEERIRYREISYQDTSAFEIDNIMKETYSMIVDVLNED